MQNKLLIKYIKGDADAREKRSVIEWIKGNAEHQKKYNLLKAQYVASELDSPISDIDKAYKRFSTKRIKNRKYYYTAVVAVLLPLLLWQLFSLFPDSNLVVDASDFFKFNTTNVATNYGDHKTVVLPDGSTIMLNAKSTLTYPKEFTDTIREVTLIGEAFFDIKRDVTKPFIVNTEHLKIKVLGTSFNVKSYPEDEMTETTLVTGKVEVIEEEIKAPIILEPSERATFDKEENKISVDKVDSEKMIAWREGKLIFNKTPLKQVVSDLSRKYEVEFKILSPKLLQYEYTGEFDNLTLEEILNLLKISSPINYKQQKNKVMIDTE